MSSIKDHKQPATLQESEKLYAQKMKEQEKIKKQKEKAQKQKDQKKKIEQQKKKEKKLNPALLSDRKQKAIITAPTSGPIDMKSMTLMGVWKSIWENRNDREKDPLMESTCKFLSLDNSIKTVADWGCGVASLKQYLGKHQTYKGIDGTVTGFQTQQADLVQFAEPADGIYMKHVLELNYNWKLILTHFLTCFKEKGVIVIWTPWSTTNETLVLNPCALQHKNILDQEIKVPDLALSGKEFLDIVSKYQKQQATQKINLTYEIKEVANKGAYKKDTVIYLTKKKVV